MVRLFREMPLPWRWSSTPWQRQPRVVGGFIQPPTARWPDCTEMDGDIAVAARVPRPVTAAGARAAACGRPPAGPALRMYGKSSRGLRGSGEFLDRCYRERPGELRYPLPSGTGRMGLEPARAVQHCDAPGAQPLHTLLERRMSG